MCACSTIPGEPYDTLLYEVPIYYFAFLQNDSWGRTHLHAAILTFELPNDELNSLTQSASDSARRKTLISPPVIAY